MAAQQRNKHTGRAKRIVVAAVALVALVAVGVPDESPAARGHYGPGLDGR